MGDFLLYNADMSRAECSRRELLTALGVGFLGIGCGLIERSNEEQTGKIYSAEVTLQKSKPDKELAAKGGVQNLLYGPGLNLVCNEETYAWEIRYEKPTQGAGFYEARGEGLATRDKSVSLRTYINPSKQNGVYEGNAKLRCMSRQGTLLEEIPLRYRITLVD